MIYVGHGSFKLEEGEPIFRSCWKCNAAHAHLKGAYLLHMCFACGRYWVLGKSFDEFKSDEEFDAFFEAQGLVPGDSTKKLSPAWRRGVN